MTSTENPYASPSNASPPGEHLDNAGFDPTLLAPAHLSVVIVTIFGVGLCAYYALSSLYLIGWLFVRGGGLTAPQEIHFIWTQVLPVTSVSVLYACAAYFDLRYLKAIAGLTQGVISWRQFATAHNLFWRRGVLVTALGTVIAIGPSIIGILMRLLS